MQIQDAFFIQAQIALSTSMLFIPAEDNQREYLFAVQWYNNSHQTNRLFKRTRP